MNFFKQIQLVNYRNFNNYFINLNKNCNVIFGKNGSGKTNILESISLFERGRGFRKETINNLINNKSTDKIFKISSKFINNHDEIDLLITNDILENKFKSVCLQVSIVCSQIMKIGKLFLIIKIICEYSFFYK